MNELTKFLVESVIGTEFDKYEETVALFGGGFKPPTKGHLDVILNGLKQNPSINKLKIIVGGGTRDGVTQDQAAEIWEFYDHLGLIPISNVEIIKASPFNYYKEYLRKNPDDQVFVFIGSREGDDGDTKDVAERTKFIKKYSDNVVPIEISTVGGISGTEARKLFKTDLDNFKKMLPTTLMDRDVEHIVDILNGKSMDTMQEPASTKTEPLSPLNEDPKKGTGKKPKGSKRRLYTDEDPKDTVGIKFSTRQDIVDTLNKKSFKAKSHARQSQIINLIHQRVRAAYGRAKDPAVKKRLKTGLDYITDKKEASKKKTQRLKNQKENIDPKSQAKHKGKSAPFGSAYEPVEEGLVDDIKQGLKSLGAKTLDFIEDFGKVVANVLNIKINKPEWAYDWEDYYKTIQDAPGLDWPGDEDDEYALAVRLATLNDKKREKLLQQGKITKEEFKEEMEDFNPTPTDRNIGFSQEMLYVVGDPLTRGKRLKDREKFFTLNENATYSSKIDYKQQIKDLTKHMLKKGMNILPLPRVIFKHGDQENASQFLGKTAYYSPSDMTVVLYTEGRHPKDIVRSFAHEMVHHIQNIEDRLENINTTNTTEDDNLNDIEREAYTKGNMTFRNWTDSLDGGEVTSLNEDLTKNSNQIYHWTSYSACKKIIESNKLKSNKSSQFFEYDESRDLPDYKNVVFFTVEGERFVDEGNSNQCILVVDKSKLSKDYKVISYGDPYEETVVYTNDSSMPILPYLKGVILMNTLQKSAVKKMVEFLESKSIPYEINDNLERKVKDKKAKLPSLKKELINKLKLKYPNGFIGYLNTPLLPYQTLEYFKDNSTYSYPNITINKPGEYGEKNKFQVKFKIEPQNLEKYINWYMYSLDFIEDLINMDNYEGEELYLKGNIPIDVETLNEKIVGEKIECDNCGWSWNIVDGGDDLYICHKCDYDNEPENGDPFGLKAFAKELVNETFKKSVTIDMDVVNAALEDGIFTDKETDESAIAIIDAAPQGKVPHPVFLDFYAKYDKYFGEENDKRVLDEFGLKQILTNVLNLPEEDIQTVINHYNTTDQDNVEWFEQHDNEEEKEEEFNIPGFNSSQDDYETVVNYRRKQLAKSLEEQERVRIFNPNCGCDKT